MSDDPLYRLYMTLADGRRVYYSRGGRVHLLCDTHAHQAIDLHATGIHSIERDDPMVFAADLGMYAPRSHFLDALTPFVMVVGMVVESARRPIDRAAFVLGGGLACEAGVWAGGGGKL